MEPTYILTCCSTADRSKEFFAEHDIPFACFHFTMDGKEYTDDLGSSIAFHDFYDRIRNGSAPVTSQVSTASFVSLWSPALENKKDILHVTLSSGISGVINSANAAAKILEEKYPDRRILILDSLGASSGYGLFMEYMAEGRDDGMSLDELYTWGKNNRLHIHHWFFSTDLTSYKRGGRISAASFAVGTVLGICPLMNMDRHGQLIPRRKIRSKKRVIHEIVKMMEEHAEDNLDYSGKCQISNSDCMDDAIEVRDLILKKFPNIDGEIEINSVGTVIGSHTGPGTIALFFKGDLRQ